LDEQTRGMEARGEWRPLHKGNISIFEPNINIVKFCLYPVLLTELAYRLRPDLINMVHVTNTGHIANVADDFNAVMLQTEVVRAGKAIFIGREQTPSFLSSQTDAVVAHQWGNPLNYLYLEVAWQGYPLIHNASLCSDIGYYYAENDLDYGAMQLISALQDHSSWSDQYIRSQRANISRFLPGHESVTAEYERLIRGLRDKRIR